MPSYELYNVEIKKKKKKKEQCATRNGKGKTNKGLGYNIWCKKKIKEAHKGGNKRVCSTQGLWL